MRYLLFAFVEHSARGGWKDLHAPFATRNEAIVAAAGIAQTFIDGTHFTDARICNTFQVIDQETGECWEGTVQEDANGKAYIPWTALEKGMGCAKVRT